MDIRTIDDALRGLRQFDPGADLTLDDASGVAELFHMPLAGTVRLPPTRRSRCDSPLAADGDIDWRELEKPLDSAAV